MPEPAYPRETPRTSVVPSDRRSSERSHGGDGAGVGDIPVGARRISRARHRSGKLVFHEDYSDMRTNVDLEDALFDPTKWRTAKHWLMAK